MNENESHTLSYRTYIYVWIVLVLLTGLTVYVAGLESGMSGTMGNILISSVKAGLVVYLFMHLKYESILIKLMLLMTVLTLTAIIGLTFLDILYR